MHNFANAPKHSQMLDLLTPRQMEDADRLASESGIPGLALMENAGRAAARAIQARLRPCRTLVLCGPGNNGGDGYVVARRLAQIGWPVTLAATGAPKRGSDAAAAAARWHGPTARFGARAAGRADLVVDAVFGAGLARDVDGVTAETLRAASRVVAIDVPSGVDGETGAIRGYAPPAVLTVTFFRRKPGHLLPPGRDLCGELVLADIGIPDKILGRLKPDTFVNAPGLFTLRPPGPNDNKYTRGTVTVCGGTMHGAAVLAAQAARHAGAGLVAIATQSAAAYVAAPPGLIILGAPLKTLLADERRKTWVCGPGLGPDLGKSILAALIAARRQIVADADALSAHANDPDALIGAAIITPHDGEFTRVFGDIGANRPHAARQAARRTGAVVLLKGSATIVAAPDGRAAITEHAPAWLATAGAGDVLAGLAAAHLAQGMPAFEAACAAAWQHARAATLAGPALIAEDLLPRIGQAAAGEVRRGRGEAGAR
jgi:hydroxyethylthiazole kinase-like uncharacterized protein yjeF